MAYFSFSAVPRSKLKTQNSVQALYIVTSPANVYLLFLDRGVGIWRSDTQQSLVPMNDPQLSRSYQSLEMIQSNVRASQLITEVLSSTSRSSKYFLVLSEPGVKWGVVLCLE